MVKVFAPALSLDASGTLGNAITFSKWKGRNYLRERVIPANPQTGAQVGLRAMMKFLAQNWNALPEGTKADWLTRAQQLVASNFNAFVSYNQRRWRNFNSPSQLDPASQDDTEGSQANLAATAGVRQITVSFDVSVLEDNWGAIIFRATTTPIAAAFSNSVAAILADAAETFSWVDSPLAAGTYYYNVRLFSEHGVMGGMGPDVNATVV